MSRCVNFCPYIGLLLLTVIAYLPLRNNDFVDFDDEKYITSNPNVIGGLKGSGIRWAWTNYEGNYWMPISWLSLQLDAHLFASKSDPRNGGRTVLSPVAFHADNLLWHTASCVLLFHLLHSLTAARWCSFLASALFAVHPMHVESVAWATERKDVLSCFFGLLTLWAYARYVQRPGWQRYLALTMAYLMSLLSKPMLLTLPFLLLLLDYWPLHRIAGRATDPAERGQKSALGRLVMEKTPLLAIAVAFGILTLFFRHKSGTVIPLSVMPWSARIANALSAYSWYLWATVYPVNLMCLYPHPNLNWSLRASLEGAILLLALTGLSFWNPGRRRWMLVGWLWFAGSLVPVLGLAQGGLQAWADRFSYWPHIGLFIAAAWGLGEIVERLRVPRLVAGAAAAVLLVCLGAGTWIQVGFWRSSVTLWERALAVQKDHEQANVHLGQYYLDLGRLDKAEFHFAEAVRLAPFFPVNQNQLGVILLALGKAKEAASHFQEALQQERDNADYWHNLGIALLTEGSPDTLENAALCFRHALRIQPSFSDSQASLGVALWRAGERKEAVRTFQDVLSRDPSSAEAWHGLGLAHLAQGKVDEAIKELSLALRKGNRANVRSDLGVALGRRNQWAAAASLHRTALQIQVEANRWLEKMNGRPPAPDSIPPVVLFRCRLAFSMNRLGDRRAAEVYRKAFQDDPLWPEKFRDKAWKLVTDSNINLRDPLSAYEFTSQSAEGVTEPSASLLDTLAAAQAALGQFVEASQSANRALKKALAESDLPLADAIRCRLKRYAKGLPAMDPGT